MKNELSPALMPPKTRLLNALRLTLAQLLPEDWLLSISGGRKSGDWRQKILPNHDQFARPTWRTATRRGVSYQLDLSELVDWYVYFDVEAGSRDTLFSLVAAGETVIDVGVNIGETLLNFARIVGAQGRVIGFEADPQTTLRAERNIGLNRFTNVTLVNAALGAAVGSATLRRPVLGNSGMNRVATRDAGGTAEIKMTTLDSYCKQTGLARVDVIKVDVEGMEREVLLGAHETIARHRPALFIEVDDANLRENGTSAAELLRLIESLGYRLTEAGTGRPPDSTPGLEAHFDVIGRPI